MDDTENDEGDIQEYILSMFPGQWIQNSCVWEHGMAQRSSCLNVEVDSEMQIADCCSIYNSK